MEYAVVRKDSDESLSMTILIYITSKNCRFESCPLHQEVTCYFTLSYLES